MAHRSVAALVVFFAAACAAPRHYGTFLEHATVPQEAGLARAAAQQLRKLYPPANTRFSLALADDVFSREFSTALRRAGFAIIDAPATNGALSVRFVVDELGNDLFRIMLIVRAGHSARTASLVTSCAYKQVRGALVPAGAWTRQTM